MKKIIILIGFVLINITGFSQIKGINLNSAAPELSDYETLTSLEGGYCIIYNQNTIGYKHCILKVYSIVEENDLDFFKPNFSDDVTIPSYAESILDYESMNLGLQTGSAEVKKIWEINGYRIAVICDSEKYGIYIVIM